MRHIVVGFDGSPNACEALRYATDEARAHGADLTIVHAWQGPVLWVDPYSINATFEALGTQARAETTRAAHAAAAELGRPVRRVVECAGAAELLVREGKAADLLVVGARGRSGVVGLILGSVANQVVHHATCPVVVVPCRSDAARSAASSDQLPRSNSVSAPLVKSARRYSVPEVDALPGAEPG